MLALMTFTGSLLPKKLTEAAEMSQQHQEVFDKLSATFSEEMKEKWLAMVAR
jgi:hypothetical protein